MATQPYYKKNKMGIDMDSALFVGAHFEDINCDIEVLRELADEGEIIRVSPHYDAESRYCLYGIEVSCDEIMAEGGIDLMHKYIKMMNETFKTTKCKLMHSPNIW